MAEREAKEKKGDRTTNGRILQVLGPSSSVARVLLVDIDGTLVKGGGYNEALIAAIKQMRFDKVILFTQRGKYMQEENLRLDPDIISIATLLEYLRQKGINAEVSTSIDPFMRSDDAFPYWEEYKKDAAYEEMVKKYFAAEYVAKFDEKKASREAKLAEILPQQSEIFKAIAGEVAIVIGSDAERKRLLELQSKRTALTVPEIAYIEGLAKEHCPKDKIAQYRNLTAKLTRDGAVPCEFYMIDDVLANLLEISAAVAEDRRMSPVGLIDALRERRFKSAEEYLHDFQLAIALTGVETSVLQRAQGLAAAIDAQIQVYREAKSKEGGVSNEKEALLADLWAAMFAGDPKKAAVLIEQSRLEGKSGIKILGASIGFNVEPTALFRGLDAVHDNITELAELVSRVRSLPSVMLEMQRVITAAPSLEALGNVANTANRLVEGLQGHRKKITSEELKTLTGFSKFFDEYLHLYRAEVRQKKRDDTPDIVAPILKAIATIGAVIAQASRHAPAKAEEKKKDEKKAADKEAKKEGSAVQAASSSAPALGLAPAASSTPPKSSGIT